ncbi:MAG: ABC transporter substrate-binding protein [Ilumatobacteraceae bacterium]
MLAVGALAACGGSSGATTITATTVSASTTITAASTTTTAAGTTTAAPATVTTVPAFPVTVTAGNGSVTVASAPQRIVSLSASLTEMLYAAGAGEQVVAVDKYSNFPPGTPMTDLSGFKPNVESIAALNPDLVLVAGDREGIVEALGAIGVTTLQFSPAVTVDDALAQLVTIGTATGHGTTADELVTQMRADLETLAAKAPHRDQPLTYYLELADDGHTVTSATFIGDVLSRAGLTSIADSAGDAAGGFPQLSNEAILAADPDVIFLAHSNGQNPTAADLAARPGWSELRAVHDGHVVTLDPDVAGRWGPRLVDLLAAAVEATAGI